ncbi:MAG: hypothetical protein JWL61_4987 [Gemmatimonadetes bacterium]|nr:hypothetical protein [Gemmatimonadota bacterium]
MSNEIELTADQSNLGLWWADMEERGFGMIEIADALQAWRDARDDDDNLQTLCDPCNQGKSDRPPHPHDWSGS